MYPNTFDEYQEASAATDHGTPKQMPAEVYLSLAVNEEAGELAGKVKKLYRDHGGVMNAKRLGEIIDEGGDVLWYLTRLCETLGIPLATLARRNIVKLQGREERGTIQGSGDNR